MMARLMSDIAKRVGRRIAAVRKRAAITQAQLAERLGTSPEVLSRIEHGINAPSLERLEEIAVALGVAPFELLVEDTAGERRAAAQRVTAAIGRLSDRDLDLLSVLADAMARRRERSGS